MKTAPWAVAASGGLILLIGCAFAANPEPPTLWLPAPVKDLTATRVGNEVHLQWAMPRDSTDKLRLKGPQRAHICWTSLPAAPPGSSAHPFSAGACQADGEAQFTPAEPAEFAAPMPSTLVSGQPRAIAYYVELQNHAGKTAGPSNPAWIATGPAPPALTGLRLEASPDGVLLHWQPAAPQPGLVLRIHRLLISQPGTPRPSETAGAPPPQEQTLEVDLSHTDAGEALDHDAALNHIWRYTAQRVLKLDIENRALEVAGLPSQPVTIDAKNIFPPPVPAGLAAVPDEQDRSINLSWIPDSVADLAGYFVYRRDLTAGTAVQRISPASPLVAPAFNDTGVQPGHRYAYSVTAIDRNGNESTHSPEVQEELPQ